MLRNGGCPDDEQFVPIGAVVTRLRATYPDVSHSSLRFLEREGLVTPSRTPGGHRLYTEGDIARIVRIKEWQRARLSLDEIRQRLTEASRWNDPSGLVADFVERGLAGRFLGAGRVLLEADDRGLPLINIFADVLEPALIEVGDRWEQGTLLVAQEKQFSETAREVIAALSQRHTPLKQDQPSIVAACVGGNHHELGLRMITGVLRSEGYPVHFLGADVDPVFLAEAAQLHSPRAILLSIDAPDRVQNARAALEAIRRVMPADRAVVVVIGGRLVSVRPDLLAGLGERVVRGPGLRAVLAELELILGEIRGTEGA